MADQEGSFYKRLRNMKGRIYNYSRLKEIRGTENKDVPTTKKGGIVSILFILVNEAFQKLVFSGLLYNMVIYLTKEYHMTTAKANNGIFIWNAATELTILLCGFISDSYMGRFSIIRFGSIFSLLGILLLWLTAVIPKSRPPPCTLSGCTSPTTVQLSCLFSTFPLISIGAGCVSCSTAFGIDQMEGIDKSEDKRAVERFFMYYYASSSLIVITTKTATAYVLDEYGWGKGFGLLLILVFLSVIMFFIRSPLYFKQKPKKNLFTTFAQVIVAACRNWNLSFPLPNSSGRYLPGKDSKLVLPTNKFRLLNKACIIKDPQQDVAPDGSALNPWRLCTIEQVEEVKALAKVFPLWSTGIMLWVNVSKTKFMLLQAGSMNRHLSQQIEIPRAMFATFSVLMMMLWVSLYDNAILPLASKIKGKPMRMGVKLRMGVGLVLSWMAMVVAAVVEIIRRKKATREGDSMDMSALWLLPQYCLIGMAESFTATGQLEFFYMEIPKSMSSVAVALLGPGTVVATSLSDVISGAVLHLTFKEGTEMIWSDIKQAPFDYYFSFLAILNYINLLYFLLCSWAYGPCCERGQENGAKLDDT